MLVHIIVSSNKFIIKHSENMRKNFSKIINTQL